MDWQTLLDYRLNDLLMLSPEVYEALHHGYLQQYMFMQWCFWLLLLVQVGWLVRFPTVLQISLALNWAWLAYVYAYQTLGQVILAGGLVATILAMQTLVHLVSALIIKLKPAILRSGQQRSVIIRISLVLAGIIPWQAIVSGQSSLSLSYGMGILPTAMVTVGFMLLFSRVWYRWLAISIPVLSSLTIFLLLFGLY